jgi:hypothetical protein
MFFFAYLNLGYFFEVYQGLPMTKSHQKKIKNASKHNILTVKSVNFNHGSIDRTLLADYYSESKINMDKYLLRESDYIISSTGKRRGFLIEASTLGRDNILFSQHFIVLRLKSELQDKSAFFHHLMDIFLDEIPYATSKSQNINYTRVKDVKEFRLNMNFDLETEYNIFQNEWLKYEKAKKQFNQIEQNFANYLVTLKNKLTLNR